MAEKTRTISGGDNGDAETNFHHTFFHQYNDVIVNTSENNSIMNASQISTTSSDCHSQTRNNFNITHNIGGVGYCRFPKLEECAHFHYERVQLGKIFVRLVEDRSDSQSSSNTSQHEGGSSQYLTNWFIMKVTPEKSDSFLIRRSIENLKMLDEMLHRCVYDRKISGLCDLSELSPTTGDIQIEQTVSMYLAQFSRIASDSLTCGPILTWLQLDNKGRRLPLADMDTMKSINTPAVGAAYGIRKYIAQACDEISIDVGDMISVIDMPSPAESTWWRGKKSHLQKSHYEVGFFPQTCVATIGDKVPRHLVLPAPLVGSLAVSPTKPVLRKHGKLIAFFRSFILSRPSRRRLKQSGIYKERVFSCDLSEHLLNSGQDIPMVLKCCAEFLEEYGIVDGIYRLSGITSNIQKLRRSFDEERIPDLTHSDIRQDIHAVSSLLKMYFRELPNPLCTYQLYDNFVEAIQTRGDSNERLMLMKETVQKLPPPHYRTLKYLATHLNTISHHSSNTGMTDRNLAIVWAPNLLRSPALESGGVAALRGVGVQAVVTEYLITNCSLIFDPNDESDRYESLQCDSFIDNESLQIEQREHHDHSFYIERPKSLNVGGPRLISLEEAQTRHNRVEFNDVTKSHPINTSGGCSSYIEVGGGPSSLPDKYHTVLPVPRSWQKRKNHSWKSLFTRNARNSNSNQDIKNSNTTTNSTKMQAKSKIGAYCNQTDDDTVKHISLRGTNSEKIGKSFDIFDTKTMDICVRSNSIDSLRTAGHSRSVSHDSYFDLLQSPLRASAVTCPSRELSELGMNFDREEPEMRIFSESESLVSSPKVAKEISRRAMRSRPDDYLNNTNSVNPSPKKQPRLNIQSPKDNHWSSNGHHIVTSTNIHENTYKRYKLEDQLSDIQYIDCSTPEHTANHSNTICAQIHNPPTSSQSSDLNNDTQCRMNTILRSIVKNNDCVAVKGRYSYPGTKLNEATDINKEERFSYPGNGQKFICRGLINDNTADNTINDKTTKGSGIVTKTIGRFSYCDPIRNGIDNNQIKLLLRSNSAEIVKRSDLGKSKLSIATPSSPIKSPRYSLLLGDTSSDNSSSINTPIYDKDLSASGSTLQSVRFPVDQPNKEIISFASDDNNCTNTNAVNELRESQNIKRELSLDLDGSKMSVDDTSLSSTNKHIINIPSTPNTPNFTHTSGNTSQSMTPSEFGYHHLNRQSAAVSPDISPKSPTNNIYEQIEKSFSSYVIGDSSRHLSISPKPTSTKLNSPIKSTINIIYKSPIKKMYDDRNTVYVNDNNDENNIIPIDNTKQTNDVDNFDYEFVNVLMDDKQRKPLLETSFDENMVYEQVKFFKGAISEVNLLLDNGNENEDANNLPKNIDNTYNNSEIENVFENQIVPNIDIKIIKNTKELVASNSEVNRYLLEQSRKSNDTNIDSDNVKSFKKSFVPMSDLNIYMQDSLELDQNISLYENVELPKQDSEYENIEMNLERTIKTDFTSGTTSCTTITTTTINLTTATAVDTTTINTAAFELSSPFYENVSNASKQIVRKLANKFETSPVDTKAPFDFSRPLTKKLDNNRNSLCMIRAKNSKLLHDSAKITRSLDENAFIREFSKIDQIEELSAHKLITDDLNAITNNTHNSSYRRMSLEFVQPKSLNPPKRLPNLNDTDNELCKYDNAQKYSTTMCQMNDCGSIPNYNLKITPTTENPISLIQHNVNVDISTKEEDDKKNVIGNVKVLGSFKLDRERIEKIKEERRHQLNEKFRSESFKSDNDYAKAKSKSKTELRDIKYTDKVDPLRFKSKSRGDVRNIRDMADCTPLDIIKTLGLQQGGGRVRRISDEKNQNDCIDYVMEDTTTTKLADIRDKFGTTTSTMKGRRFDRKDSEANRDRDNILASSKTTNTKGNTQRERISPQISIRDVAAMFESRSQNH